MKNRWANRVYVDVMAGPGICKVRNDGREIKGSPLIALGYAFTRFVFVEQDPGLCKALEQRVSRHSKAHLATVICADWQQLADRGEFEFPNAIVLAFVDPTGISQVPWKSVDHLLTGNKAIDLLFTIQYAMGITLNAGKYSLAKHQKTALDRFLDEGTWRNNFDARIPSTFREQVLNRFSEKMSQLGFSGSLHNRRWKQNSVPDGIVQ
jgi:three-Cys-motif partner protein